MEKRKSGSSRSLCKVDVLLIAVVSCGLVVGLILPMLAPEEPTFVGRSRSLAQGPSVAERMSSSTQVGFDGEHIQQSVLLQEEEENLPSMVQDEEPLTDVEIVVRNAQEQGILAGIVITDVLEILSEIERSKKAGDDWRFKIFLRKLTNRTMADIRVQDFLLELMRVWPWEPTKRSYLHDSMLTLLMGVPDQEFSTRFLAVLHAKEEDLFASRLREPAAIVAVLDGEGSPEDKLRVLKRLTSDELQDKDVREALARIVRTSSDPEHRRSAMFAHINSRPSDETVSSFILDTLEIERDPEVRHAAVQVLGYQKGERVVDKLASVLQEGEADQPTRRFAAQGLGRQESSAKVTQTLIDAFTTETELSVQKSLVKSLGRHAHDQDVGLVLMSIVGGDASDDLRVIASKYVWKSPNPEVAQLLSRLALEDPNDMIRKQADRSFRRLNREG